MTKEICWYSLPTYFYFLYSEMSFFMDYSEITPQNDFLYVKFVTLHSV